MSAYNAMLLTQFPKSEMTCPYQRFLKEGFSLSTEIYPVELLVEVSDVEVFTGQKEAVATINFFYIVAYFRSTCIREGAQAVFCFSSLIRAIVLQMLS